MASRPETGTGAAAPLRQALEHALAAPAPPASLRLVVDCRQESRLRSLQVFGNGVGILDERTQFRLARQELDGLLRALLQAGFPELETTYGEAELDAVTMMTCRVEAALDGAEKEVVQLAEGEQSPVLRQLAHDLLAACEPAARTGVTAAGLRDGLQKLASGELAPESWSLTLHRRPEGEGGRPAGAGFVLHIAAGRAASREQVASEGYGERRELELRPEEVRELAGELAARDLAGWPGNLYAPDYVDLAVRVLNHEKSVQARQFAGLDPAVHPAPQQELAQVLAILERVHRRVVEAGTTAEPR